MNFYDRTMELAILQDSEQQSFESSLFTVLMGCRRVGYYTKKKMFDYVCR